MVKNLPMLVMDTVYFGTEVLLKHNIACILALS